MPIHNLTFAGVGAKAESRVAGFRPAVRQTSKVSHISPTKLRSGTVIVVELSPKARFPSPGGRSLMVRKAYDDLRLLIDTHLECAEPAAEVEPAYVEYESEDSEMGYDIQVWQGKEDSAMAGEFRICGLRGQMHR